MSDKTSIQVTKDTKDRLDKVGMKTDTYDAIIQRLLDQMGVKGRKRKAE
uniref:Uncharacterized protein n=1 Tax=viral metagenome TaxID=1070528 RepID=A0A6M3LCC0_9ZZZZ